MSIDKFRDEYLKKYHRPALPVWKGTPVEELTREELIEALVELIQMWEADRMRFQDRLKTIGETFR